ncbi:MAG: hypothetical protein AAF563_22050 [Pseudomonadota bacterium]
MPKLMIGRTAISGANLVASHATMALRIAWLPFLLLVITEFAYHSLGSDGGADIVSSAEVDGVTSQDDGMSGDDRFVVSLGQSITAADWTTFGLYLVSTLGYVLLTVGWVRFVLTGERGSFLSFGSREIKLYLAYILWTIWLIVLVFTATVTASVLAELSPWLAGLAAILLTIVAMLWSARLLMIFPMISLNEGMGWLRAWTMTRGNGWRLLIGLGLCFVLAVVIVFVIGVALQLLASGLLSGTTLSVVVSTMIQQALTVLFLMVFLGSMAEAYRQLGGPGTAVPEDVLTVFDA